MTDPYTRQLLVRFLEWIASQGYHICMYDDDEDSVLFELQQPPDFFINRFLFDTHPSPPPHVVPPGVKMNSEHRDE
jgi:hypothetical protein